MSPKQDAYQAVTDRIVAALESGVVPWRKPWRSLQGEVPTSLQTGKPYRGINVWLLGITAQMAGYSSPYWVTFKQARERGGNVRKGEKGTQVILWKPIRKEVEGENGESEEKQFLLLRAYTVFNLEQTEGIEMPEVEPLPEREPIAACEAVVTGYLQGPRITNGGNQACYMPYLDSIQMPKRGQFDSSESYYGTLFHELAHSTGHESRLKRELNAFSMNAESYSKEELVAEMAAAFLCGEAGIEVNVEHSAAYIGMWLKRLQDDKKFVVQAAAQAQKASDHVLGLDREAD